MKKKAIRRELTELQSEQHQLWQHIAQLQHTVLELMDTVYDSEDNDGDGDGVEAPRLKVVGDD